MIVYFTGTGNSRFAAELIADKTGGELLNAFPFIRAREGAQLESDTPWVFVSPTHGWRIARIFEEFLRKSKFSGDRRAYFVMTCGDDIGNAGEYLARLCADLGLEYMGVHAAVMPENYVAMFPVPGRGESAAIIERAAPRLVGAADFISRGRAFPTGRVSTADKMKSGIVNGAFYKFFVKSDAFYSTDECTGCGLCEKSCPAGAITIVNGRPQWGAGCVHCMACICRCPKKAVEYGKKSLGKPRYVCPEYKSR